MTQINLEAYLNDSDLVWVVSELHEDLVQLAFLEGQLTVLNGLFDSSQGPVWSRPSGLQHDYLNLNSGQALEPFYHFSLGLLALLKIQKNLMSSDGSKDDSHKLIKTWFKYFSLESAHADFLQNFSAFQKWIDFKFEAQVDSTKWHRQVSQWLLRIRQNQIVQLQKLWIQEKKLSLYEKYDLNRRQRSILNWLVNSRNNDPAVQCTNRELVQKLGSSRESLKRDLQQLVAWGLIQKRAAGRSTFYLLQDTDELS